MNNDTYTKCQHLELIGKIEMLFTHWGKSAEACTNPTATKVVLS